MKNVCAWVWESKVCEYAKEIFCKMVELGNQKNWTFWMSDQQNTKQLLGEAVKACHLVNEFSEDKELYEGDIQWLIQNAPD